MALLGEAQEEGQAGVIESEAKKAGSEAREGRPPGRPSLLEPRCHQLVRRQP